jgi:NAD(P)-dependent dehydrogenase (short-subunit alcohol dehydrogenase family)
MMTYKPLGNLDGQVAVITGAMGGIGFATAGRLANRGARIIGIVRRDLEESQAKLNTLPNSQLEHRAILADVNDKSQVNDAVKQAIAIAGQCNILVNTHGQTRRIPHERIEILTDDFFDDAVQKNLRSYFTVIRGFVPLMKKSPEGLIVNIGSAAGQNAGSGSNIAYCSAKAGIDALTRNLSRVLAPDIRVVGVSPGALATKFVPNIADGFYENVVKGTPLKRVPDVEDVAATVEAIATLIRFVTGNVITVDGGRTL